MTSKILEVVLLKRITILVVMALLLLLAACVNEESGEEELATLEVEFIVPETAEPGETVQLEAIVSYGDEMVEDADEVMFEYWVQGNETDSTNVEGIHKSNGSYTAEVEFAEDGIYELYAHTTARGLHTMPLKSIAVGDAEEAVHQDEEHVEHEHSDGFQLHFSNPENIQAGDDTDLIVHLQLEGEELENANVRFEILPEQGEHIAWVDANETKPGEYAAVHEFSEAGTYSIVIHVEDDADLHEHEEYTIEVQ